MATNSVPPRVYDDAEAARFAGLWAGLDTGNLSEPEAWNKFKQLRRMAAEKNLRAIDALELAEIRKAIDEQLQPSRAACSGCAAAQAETQTAKAALAERERHTHQLIDRYEAELKRIKTASQQQTQHHRGVGKFLGYAWGFAQWRLALLLAFAWARPWIMAQSFFAQHPWTGYAFILIGLWFLLLWAAAEIDETGWSQLLMKFSAAFAALTATNANPESAWLILGILITVAGTRLINNLCIRLKRVPTVAKFVELFV